MERFWRVDMATSGLSCTEDKDFGALIFREGRPSVGVVLVRIDRIDAATAQVIAARILALPDQGRSAFTTITLDSVRARPLP